MKTQIITSILLLIIIGLASAIFSGETYTNDFGYEIINCSIINNTYDLEGLNLTWGGSIVTINISINYQPDNFTLSCWINQSYEIVEVKKSSGGWGRPNKPINLTNQTQQGNISSETLLNNISAPADNQTNNIASDELNKGKGFFNSIGNWFKGVWNRFKNLWVVK